jgi:hypothetical protein
VTRTVTLVGDSDSQSGELHASDTEQALYRTETAAACMADGLLPGGYEGCGYRQTNPNLILARPSSTSTNPQNSSFSSSTWQTTA